MSNQPKTRLDMRHGFMKCIIKNQVERDNYDKEVKAKFNEKPQPVNLTKQKKPEIQTYIPPARSRFKKEDERTVLFDLEYIDQTGKMHCVSITKGDDLKTVSRIFGQQVGLTEDLMQALDIKINEEVEKRLNGRDS